MKKELKEKLNTIKLYAGYYELFITERELPAPYCFQCTFVTKQDAIDYLLQDNDETDGDPRFDDILSPNGTNWYVDEKLNLGYIDDDCPKFKFVNGKIRLIKTQD